MRDATEMVAVFPVAGCHRTAADRAGTLPIRYGAARGRFIPWETHADNLARGLDFQNRTNKETRVFSVRVQCGCKLRRPRCFCLCCAIPFYCKPEANGKFQLSCARKEIRQQRQKHL